MIICEDCIHKDVCGLEGYYEEALKFCANKMEERPTHGEWIKGREISRTMIGPKIQHIEYKDYTCSNCGLVLDGLLYNYDGSPFYKFCPNCGEPMREEIENVNSFTRDSQ